MLEISTKIRKLMTSAIADYNMLQEGDRVMVATSGGKDSTILLLLLNEIQKRAEINFTVDAVILDQKQPGFVLDEYRAWLKNFSIDLKVIEEDTYSIVQEKIPENKTYCGLCSRLRRGILYSYAKKNGYSKIALGHHRDDINQTALMNLFYIGTLAAMPPKLLADDKSNVVIRPLAYVSEDLLLEYSKLLGIPVIPCNLCGSQENLSRQKIKSLLKNLEQDIPHIQASIQKSLSNIKPSQLMDLNFFDFKSLELERENP